jgi:thiamine-phosphate pyrophosphorylase
MNISRLHYITQEINGMTHDQLAEEACKAGVNWVQLRVKDKGYEEFLVIAKRVKEICLHYNATFIVNDNVSVARGSGAHGVHLGRTDMDPIKARELLGNNFIIGGTANTMDDIRILHEAKVDYIGLGPFKFTITKENLSPILGMEGYHELIKKLAAENVKIPVIAIGGIAPADMKDLMSTGIYGVAVSSVINLSANKGQVISEINSYLEKTVNTK